MSGLGYGYFPKHAGYFLEPFFVCDLGKTRIHFGCLIIFTFGGVGEILLGGPNHTSRKSGCYFKVTALEKLEKPFGMLFFLIRCFEKNGGDLLKTIFSGLAGKIGITIPCMRLTGKSY